MPTKSRGNSCSRKRDELSVGTVILRCLLPCGESRQRNVTRCPSNAIRRWIESFSQTANFSGLQQLSTSLEGVTVTFKCSFPAASTLRNSNPLAERFESTLSTCHV